MVDDIERIEVIRGPGAALWGANAVNGVINIVTKSARETQGSLVRVDAGSSVNRPLSAIGGSVGAAGSGVRAQWTGLAPSLLAPGQRAKDACRGLTMGLRADWNTHAGPLALEGVFRDGQARALFRANLNPQTAAREPLADEASKTNLGFIRGQWTHTSEAGAALQVQSFFDDMSRQDPWATLTVALSVPTCGTESSSARDTTSSFVPITGSSTKHSVGASDSRWRTTAIRP